VTPGDPGPPECRPDQVRVTVEWQPREDGGLGGWVVVENTGARACRLTGKPALRPLDATGRPLDTSVVVSLELRRPDSVIVPPGGRARAAVSWAGWSGPPAGDRALVRWGGPGQAEATASVRGPAQPARTTEPHNLTSSWFGLDA
jgi:Protein of unknown function (DUF4232)